MATVASIEPVPLTEDETTLVARAKRGGRYAIELLVKRHQKSLRQFVKSRVAEEHEIDDICQEVLLKMHQKLGGFEGRASLCTWLLTIAAHTIASYYRKRRLHPVVSLWAGDGAVSQGIDLVSTPLDGIQNACDARTQLRTCLTCIVQNLFVEQQLAVVLSEVYEETDKDAACTLGMTVPTFKHHLHRARAALSLVSPGGCLLVSKTSLLIHECHRSGLVSDTEFASGRKTLGLNTGALCDLRDKLIGRLLSSEW